MVSIIGVIGLGISQTAPTEIAVCSVCLIVYYVFKQAVYKVYPVSVTAEVLLATVCLVSFILILRMDVAHFSEVTLKGQKKLAVILFLQVSRVVRGFASCKTDIINGPSPSQNTPSTFKTDHSAKGVTKTPTRCSIRP